MIAVPLIPEAAPPKPRLGCQPPRRVRSLNGLPLSMTKQVPENVLRPWWSDGC
jgi:hypothetical protein